MDCHEARPTDKFMLWVDAVGGFLVCGTDEVMLGQPVRCSAVDIPILGDISSRHALIRRDGEGYMIEAIREVWVDERAVDRTALLGDGNHISLGRGVRMSFRRPHALSATVRLDMLSRHRTEPPTDGILLMADSCILGPSPNCHVVCRDWPHEVILYRHGEELFCRVGGPNRTEIQNTHLLEIDGQLCKGKGRITRNSHIRGKGFSLSLEELAP
ncbi:MAG TPA: FHA domain-containing protein [Thermoguttaceae bacterium]|nr:FHA domain-containing protein [Thermoguttaceae bacterium]